jgi:hypothetical protein
MFFQTIDEATSIWIKGREFTIGRMLGDYYRDKAPEYEGGSLAIFRLAPQDYHRYHSVRHTASTSTHIAAVLTIFDSAAGRRSDGQAGVHYWSILYGCVFH